jgi:hypothetical protein
MPARFPDTARDHGTLAVESRERSSSFFALNLQPIHRAFSILTACGRLSAAPKTGPDRARGAGLIGPDRRNHHSPVVAASRFSAPSAFRFFLLGCLGPRGVSD